MKKKAMLIVIALSLVLVAVTIYAMGPIWVCSNHNPAHTATSAGQLQELSNLHGCAGWHRIR
jgi:flagellar basal body-associated protein FliL